MYSLIKSTLAPVALGALLTNVTLAQSAIKGLSTIDLKGKLETLAVNQLMVKADGNKDYTVVFDPSRVNFQYKGTSDSGILGPGLLVRFTAGFDNQGNATAPIKELEVFSPRSPVWLSEREIREQTPGIYLFEPEVDDSSSRPKTKDDKKFSSPQGQTFSKDPSSKSTTASSSRSKQKFRQTNRERLNGSPQLPSSGNGGTPVEYRIVGRILNVQADLIHVHARTKQIVVQLDQNAKIGIVSTDPVFCAQGDMVEVHGQYQEKLAELIHAESIVVEGHKPIESMDASLKKALSKSSNFKENQNSRKTETQPSQNSERANRRRESD